MMPNLLSKDVCFLPLSVTRLNGFMGNIIPGALGAVYAIHLMKSGTAALAGFECKMDCSS